MTWQRAGCAVMAVLVAAILGLTLWYAWLVHTAQGSLF